MARIDTLINFLTDVAAAIKAKKGDDTAIPAANFDTEITNLSSGGGEGSDDNTTLISLIDRTVTSIEIPEGTTSIGFYAFAYCLSLASIIIPDGVTSIGSGAFAFCTSLTSITIPDSVTSIDDGAFEDCTNLTEIDFSTHTTVPTLIATTVFNNTSARLVIKVPSALVDEWKAATNWSTYADKIVGV